MVLNTIQSKQLTWHVQLLLISLINLSNLLIYLIIITIKIHIKYLFVQTWENIKPIKKNLKNYIKIIILYALKEKKTTCQQVKNRTQYTSGAKVSLTIFLYHKTEQWQNKSSIETIEFCQQSLAGKISILIPHIKNLFDSSVITIHFLYKRDAMSHWDEGTIFL